MQSHSSLGDLIEILERGNKYRICIHFFNKEMVQRLQVPRRNVVHDNPYCDLMKDVVDDTQARCIRCRYRAIEKACREKIPFAGLCTFGLFESCYPVFQGDVPLCVICVGNILSDEEQVLQRSGLQPDDPVLDTLQRDMPESVCFQISSVIASFILMQYNAIEDIQTPSIHPTVAAIRDHVDSFFYQKLSLETLAQQYHYNEKYLGNLFKRNMGISFRDYLNNCRLKYARGRLTDTTSSIVDIASQAGFSNVTYFNRVFKEKYGVTPSKYREKHRVKR